MKNTHITEIDAPPAEVFKWIHDGDRTLRWLPNLVEAEVLQAEPGEVGTTFRQVYDQNGRRMEMRGTIVVFQPDRRLACAITGPLFDLAVDYCLEDLGGRTRLQQHSQIRFKNTVLRFIGMLLQPLTRGMATRQYAQAFDRLKACIAAEPD